MLLLVTKIAMEQVIAAHIVDSLRFTSLCLTACPNCVCTLSNDRKTRGLNLTQ